MSPGLDRRTGNATTGLVLFAPAPLHGLRQLARSLGPLLAATVGNGTTGRAVWPLSDDKRAREKTDCSRGYRKSEKKMGKRRRRLGKEERRRRRVHPSSSGLIPSPPGPASEPVEISSRPWSTKLLPLSKSLELEPGRAYIWPSRRAAAAEKVQGEKKGWKAPGRRRSARASAYELGEGKTKEARVVKPRLQIYDIELEVKRTLEAGLIKFDDRELRNENETRKEVEQGDDEGHESAAYENFLDTTSPVIYDIS